MSIGTDLLYASIDDLYLDPQNPRLGRANTVRGLSQEEILELMATWTLEELALSYLENGGFWTHEALLVVRENHDGLDHLVVVEGNRRLAALINLKRAYQGQPLSRKWETIAASATPSPDLFSRVPYFLVGSRSEVQAFLGFRHVTGIKQWDADEKAGFIAMLIDEEGMSYEQVMRKIGSKTPTVRQHYIAYRTLLQIEEDVESFDPGRAEQRFAILYMSIQTEGVRNYLQIDIMADPQIARRPVPPEYTGRLTNFSRWLFGVGDEVDALITDTRQVSSFGKILESEDARAYLERSSNPRFDIAERIAGGDEEEVVRYVEEAANNLELALSRAHLFREAPELQKAVRRLGAHAIQLMKVFPNIYDEMVES